MNARPHTRLGAFVRALVRNLLLSGLMIGVCLALWTLSPPAGSLAMLITSGWMLLRSYRREWPLHWLTCLMPALSAVGCYVVQAALFGGSQPSALAPPAIMVGLVFGLLRGRAHRVFVRGARVFARRTSLYLAVWMACVVLTQGAAVFAVPEAVSFTLAGGAFTTTMVVAMSLVLFKKYLAVRPRPAGAAVPRAVALVLVTGALMGSATYLAAVVAAQAPTVMQLPDGTVGAFYVFELRPASPAPSLEWQVGSGSLPDGLQIDNQGRISGTPSSQGTWEFTVRVTGGDGRWGERSCAVTIRAAAAARPDAGRPGRAGGMDIYEVASRLLRPDEIPQGFDVIDLTTPENKAKAVQHFASQREMIRGLGLGDPDDVGAFMASPDRFRTGFGVVGVLLMHFADAQTPRGAVEAVRNRAAAEPEPDADIQVNPAACGDDSLGIYMGATVGGVGLTFLATGEWLVVPSVALPDSSYYRDASETYQAEKREVAEARRKADTIALRDRLTCIAVRRLGELPYAGYARSVPGFAGSAGAGPIGLFDLIDRLRQMIADQHGGAPLPDEARDASLFAALLLLFSGATANTAVSVAVAAAAAAQSATEAAAASAAEADTPPPPTAGASQAAIDAAEEERWEREASDRFRRESTWDFDAARRDREASASPGARWDDEQQAYVWDSVSRSQDENRVDEFYRRGDWVQDHLGDLSGEQRAAAERLMARVDWRGHGVDPADVGLEDLDTLRRLSAAMGDTFAGQREARAADADRDAADAQLAEDLDTMAATAGQLAAGYVEGTFVPFTHGAMSSFVFGALSSRDQGLGNAVENGAIGAVESWVGGRLSDARPGSFSWQVVAGGLTGGAGAAARGGGLGDMAAGAAEQAAWGAFGSVMHRGGEPAPGVGPRRSAAPDLAESPRGGRRPQADTGPDGHDVSLRADESAELAAARNVRRRVTDARRDVEDAQRLAAEARENLARAEDNLGSVRASRDDLRRRYEAGEARLKDTLESRELQVKNAESAVERARRSCGQARDDVSAAAQAFDRAAAAYSEADPRRHLDYAQNQVSVAERRVRDAGARLDELRDAEALAERAARDRPADRGAALEVEAARRQSADAQRALDRAYAERVRAGENLRTAAERLQVHMSAEDAGRDRIDQSIRETFGLTHTAAADTPGQLRIVDERELHAQYARDDPGDTGPAGLRGFNAGTTSRSVAAEWTPVHERLHANTSPRFHAAEGTTLTEGFTDHFASKVIDRQRAAAGITDAPVHHSAYDRPRDMVARLERIVGEEATVKAYFDGDFETLHQRVGEALGVRDSTRAYRDGTRVLDALSSAMKYDKCAEAQRLLGLMQDGNHGEAWSALCDLEAVVKAAEEAARRTSAS